MYRKQQQVQHAAPKAATPKAPKVPRSPSKDTARGSLLRATGRPRLRTRNLPDAVSYFHG